jgi:hypothetical protein
VDAVIYTPARRGVAERETGKNNYRICNNPLIFTV